MVDWPRRAALSTVFLLPASGAFAQEESIAAGAQCRTTLSDYQDYRLRNVSLRSPFLFLRSLQSALEPTRPSLPAAGTPFDAAGVTQAVSLLDKAVRDSPLPSPPFSVTIVYAAIDRCDDAARELDLAFYVFTSRLVAPSSWSWEFGQTLREDPGSAAGLSSVHQRFTLAPTLTYNRADNLVAGGRATFLRPAGGFGVAAEGAASNRYVNAALLVSGSKDLEAEALWRASYAAGYRLLHQPLGNQELREGYAFAWFSGATRPLRSISSAIRYASQFQKGYQVSPLGSGAGFQGDARYSALKLLTGASGGKGAHDYSLNFALQLGFVGSEAAYRKFLLDGVYSVRATPKTQFFDHRSLDFDVRCTAGWLSPLGDDGAPQNERFFGGLRPHPFTDIPGWDVRTAPSIRGYPNQRFYALLEGHPSGRERFFSMNLTSALTGWRRPLLPPELYTNPEFLAAIEGQSSTARHTLILYHESRDPAMRIADEAAALLQPVLTRLQEQVEALSVPDDLSGPLDLCQESLDKALGTLQKARSSRFFGVLLNRNVRGGIPLLFRDCEEELNGRLDNAEIHTAARQIEQARAAIDRVLTTQVDHHAAERKADQDFAIVDRALDAFVHEINLVSLDPVFVFDAAYAGPTLSSRFLRYALGAGLRLTLGSHVSFTIGYAGNLNRAQDEPRGAVFFEMKFYDLIR